MTQTTPLYGHSAPSNDDPLDADALAADLDTIATVVKAASAVEAAQRVQPAMLPCLVLRTDNDTMWLYSAAHPDGDQIAGRGHGARWTGNRSDSAHGGLTAIDVTGFAKASAGWALGDDAYSVRVPATGLYSLTVIGKMGGTPYVGRNFMELLVNNTIIARFPGNGDNDWSGSIDWDLVAGDQIKIQGYQVAGSARTLSCIVVAVQISNPAWVTI
jgi:hypothetical protein